MVRAASFEEALALTNAHEYGNGTCLFTADGATARRFVDEVNVGMVGVNVPVRAAGFLIKKELVAFSDVTKHQCANITAAATPPQPLTTAPGLTPCLLPDDR